MAHLEELPLFPLHTVLFPYATIQLHVFEDRYRELVHHCVQFDEPFGIVLIRTGSEVGGNAEPYMVGTAVRVQKVHTYDDGQMDIEVRGERRFRVRSLDESKPYLVAMVEPVVELDLEDNPRLDALFMRATESFRLLIEGAFSRQDFKIQVRFPTDPTVLSFVIANFLPMENLEKQRMLETTDTLDRLSELIPLIERQIIEAKTPKYYKVSLDQLQEWIHQN